MNWMVFFILLASCAIAQPDQSWKLYYDSTQAYWAKDWNKTVSLLQKAEKSALSDLGIYHENYLTILNDLGTAYWKAKRYSEAETALLKSFNLKSEVYPENDKEVILSMSNLAGFYAEQGFRKKSKTLYHRIMGSNPAHIPADIYVGAVQGLVSLYDLDQQPDSASIILQLIEKRNIIPANSYLAFQHLFYRARVHRKLQEYDEAQAVLDNLLSALPNRIEPEHRELYVQCLQEQGILYLQTGAYNQAERNLLSAYRAVTPEMNSDYLLTELSNNLAQVYDKLNIHNKALVYYQEALDRCRTTYPENSLPCVTLQNNIAGIHLKQDNVSQAITDYQKVIVEFEKLLPVSDPLYITALNNIATAYRKNNQLAAATHHLQRAEKLLKDGGKSKEDLAATVLNNIAVLNTAQGEYLQAADHYERAYAIKRSIYGNNSILLMDLIGNLAVTYWALNKPKEAIPLFKKSMELATRQVAYVFPNLNENEQVQFYDKLKEDFERFNSIAVHWRDKDPDLVSRMFENCTMIKSLQFFTNQRRKKQIGLKNDPVLNELVADLKDSRDRLGHLYQLPLNQIAKATDIRTLETEIDSLEKAISLRSSESLSGDMWMPGDVKWKSIAERLQPNEAIVEIVRFRKYDRQSSKRKESFGFSDSVRYAALILTGATKRPDVIVFGDGNNLETRYFNYYKNAMKYGIEDKLSYGYFWEPIEKRLPGKTRIYFCPDGVYHRININTLFDNKEDKFLLDKYDIVYLLNALQYLDKKRPMRATKRTAVLMGDPVFDVDVNGPRERTPGFDHFVALPGTKEELQAIEKVLKANAWKTNTFVREAATEANLKAVNSPSILHVASHGFFSPDVVSLNAEAKKEFLFHSGIVLAGANKSMAAGSTSFYNDGIVTAFEVMNLDLTHTRLVVLSACETGLGKIENGEGVFGLQRSFMQAGAKNVLISLWKVDDDATRDLMTRFYQNFTLGETLHDALRKAQSDQAKALSNPSLWGGFVLIGNN